MSLIIQSTPVEIGRYTPERSNVWGVFVDRNYVLASDMNSGLKVLLKNNAGGKKGSITPTE